MNFFIVDESKTTRTFLTTMIHANELGLVIDGIEEEVALTYEQLLDNNIDVLIIHYPYRHLEKLKAIEGIRPVFNGTILMISSIIDKCVVADAYSIGVDYYITEPLNEIELVTIINKIRKDYLQRKSLLALKEYIDTIIHPLVKPTSKHGNLKSSLTTQRESHLNKSEIKQRTANILVDLGIMGQSGYQDILNIIEYLYQLDTCSITTFSFPPMKDLFYEVARNNNASSKDLDKEAKALEQRVRRAILQSINHLASIGATDFGNITFDRYATTFFDFSPIRARMLELEGKKCYKPSNRLNIKKFIQVLYREVKDLQ